jgi:betaine-homocysteine S-methyltransferase
MVTMSFEKPEPRAYEGETPGEAAKKLADAGADVVGVNCLNGPEQMLPIAAEMAAAVDTPVAAQPVAYRTTKDMPDFTSWENFPYALDSMQVNRGEMADFAVVARDAGGRDVGSCCGVGACHVRARARQTPLREREWRSPTGKPMSGYEYYDHTETELDPN